MDNDSSNPAAPARSGQATGYALYDVKGTPIHLHDTLKVFQYISAVRRERRYMYNFVVGVETHPRAQFLRVGYLDGTDSYYWLRCDGRRLMDYEVVQGHHGDPSGCNFRNRKRLGHNKGVTPPNA